MSVPSSRRTPPTVVQAGATLNINMGGGVEKDQLGKTIWNTCCGMGQSKYITLIRCLITLATLAITFLLLYLLFELVVIPHDKS